MVSEKIWYVDIVQGLDGTKFQACSCNGKYCVRCSSQTGSRILDLNARDFSVIFFQPSTVFRSTIPPAVAEL